MLLNKVISGGKNNETEKEKEREKEGEEKRKKEKRGRNRKVGRPNWQYLVKCGLHRFSDLVFRFRCLSSALLCLQVHPPALATLIPYSVSGWLIQNFMGKSGNSPSLDSAVLLILPGFLPDRLHPLCVAVDHVTWLLSSFSTALTVSSRILSPCLSSKQLPTSSESMALFFLSKPNFPSATGPYHPPLPFL